MPHFDFIVIGSGSSGGVVAARLSESGKYSVLCLEAGVDGYLWTRFPAGTAFMIENPHVNWCRYSTPNDSTADRPLYVPGGKMLGGTSAINGMIFNRGQRTDYDRWAEAGCSGWSYEEVLPYFKKLESTQIGSDRYRGRTGPVKVTVAEKTSPFFDMFIESARAVGYPLNPTTAAIRSTAWRWRSRPSTAAFARARRLSTLMPARKRPNLTIETGAEATSLILEGKRCVGVRYRRNGVMPRRARRER